MSIIPFVRLGEGPKPFLKWAGGKQAQAGFLIGLFPPDATKYFEPFVGGGSVALAFGHPRTFISDANSWLMDTYRAIRDDWERVARTLNRLPNTREEFLRIRALHTQERNLYRRAAYLIYLNKTCFRGLFRVNRKGQFNVPYGAYDRRYYDPANLAAVASVLEDVEIRSGDFETGTSEISEGDFAYFDPPYYKLGGYSDFNRYTPGQFRENDHLRLATVCRELDGRGVRWLTTNSDTPLVRTLFNGFELHEIQARREINLNSKKRSVGELVIANYELQLRPRTSAEREEPTAQPVELAT